MKSPAPYTESPVQTFALARHHAAFRALTDEELRELLPFFTLVELKAGSQLVTQGESKAGELYFVVSGELEVTKQADAHSMKSLYNLDAAFPIAKLQLNDIIGELGFYAGLPRAATIRSLTASQLLMLDKSAEGRMAIAHPQLALKVMRNMLGLISQRVQKTSSNEVQTLKRKLENSLLYSSANLFFSYVIALLCIYNLTLHLISELSMSQGQSSLVSAVIILAFGGGLALMIKQSRLPASVFGLTLRQWKTALRESLGWSAVVIGLLVVAKWIAIQTVPALHGLPLVRFSALSEPYLIFNFVLYGLHSPIQEFVARGVLQGSLQHFFKGRNVTLRAIIVSNALFSATHVHLLNGLLGVIVFVPGLLWGWLYARHGTLVGVSISHLLIGWTGLFLLDVETMIALL